MMETWKPIAGTDGVYEVSNMGRILSHPHATKDGRVMKGKYLTLTTNKRDGYVRVGLYVNGARIVRTVHRIVAEAFVPNPMNKPEINHKDGCKTNNRADNLEWCTPSENQQHSLRNGLRPTRAVDAFTKDGVYVRSFKSFADAARWAGASDGGSGISDCLRGRNKTAYGYIWKPT